MVGWLICLKVNFFYHQPIDKLSKVNDKKVCIWLVFTCIVIVLIKLNYVEIILRLCTILISVNHKHQL